MKKNGHNPGGLAIMIGTPMKDGLGGMGEDHGEEDDDFATAAAELFVAAKRDDEDRFAKHLKHAIEICIAKYEDDADDGGDDKDSDEEY